LPFKARRVNHHFAAPFFLFRPLWRTALCSAAPALSFILISPVPPFFLYASQRVQIHTPQGKTPGFRVFVFVIHIHSLTLGVQNRRPAPHTGTRRTERRQALHRLPQRRVGNVQTKRQA